MKYLSIVLFLFLGMAIQADAQVTVSEEKVAATVTDTFSRMDLTELRNDLMEHGLEMRYDKIQWAGEQLISIRIRVQDDNGDITEYTNEAIEAGTQIHIIKELTGDKTLCVGTDCE